MKVLLPYSTSNNISFPLVDRILWSQAFAFLTFASYESHFKFVYSRHYFLILVWSSTWVLCRSYIVFKVVTKQHCTVRVWYLIFCQAALLSKCSYSNTYSNSDVRPDFHGALKNLESTWVLIIIFTSLQSAWILAIWNITPHFHLILVCNEGLD